MTEMSPCAGLKPSELALVDRWQRGFPVEPRPFAVVAETEGMREADVLDILSRLTSQSVIARVGATVRPNTAGASMLAAMRVPPDRLAAVAAIVNREPTVNHNYEREHDFNLWFVVTGANRSALAASLARIRAATGLDVMELPLERSYFIDLGFDLSASDWAGKSASSRAQRHVCPGAVMALDVADRRLLALLSDGLALTSDAYADLAAVAGLDEEDALERIRRMIASGIISRLGVIVRHRALGFRANAMAVWDIPDAEVDAVGRLFAGEPFVTLCYRRPRRLPDWPYNLFCMVHGRARDSVTAQVASLSQLAGVERCPHAILFSRRCFRQRGARLV